MDAFAISSPLRQRISQDIHDLQAEIGREAARAYCACRLESPRLMEKAPESLVQDLPSELRMNYELSFDDFMNFPGEDWQAVEMSYSDGNSRSQESDPPETMITTASETVIGKPSGGRSQRAAPVVKADCAIRTRILAFLNRYWYTLHKDGLFTQIRRQNIDPEDPERTRRLREFSMLRALEKDDDFRYLRRAVALLRNLENFEVFHREAAHLRSCGRQSRLQHETDKQVAYNKYLAYIYAGESGPIMKKARQALISDLRFARRWLLLTNPLTTGAVLVCEESVCKKVSV